MTLKVTPYPYQQEGIQFGLQRKRILIADQPGLGKTLQSIGIVDKANAYPCLVICPSCLKINWQREFHKFTDKQALVLDHSCQTTFPYLLQMQLHHVAITNYESLKKYFIYDVQKKNFRLKDIIFAPAIQLFKSVIIDESHRVKDPTTAQAKFAKGITKGKPYIILLSGTPVVNNPKDLVAQLSILERLHEFGGQTKFITQYADNNNLHQLSQQLYNSCMISREKDKVLTQLPPKTRTDVYLDIANRDEYTLAEKDLRQYLTEYTECTDKEIRRKMRMEALVKFMTLRSLSSYGKIQPAIDFIKLFLESRQKLILFCSLHNIVDQLLTHFPKAVCVTGRNTMTEKQNAVDKFQNDPNTQLIICSIKAAGVGLTLTASSTVVFLEFPWTYADCCQCEDRAHRIGQKDNVTCYYLIGKNTLDDTLYHIIHKKKTIANQIMNTDDTIPKDQLYFDNLVQNFVNNNDQK